MKLTKITLNPIAYRARGLLANPHAMHAAIAASFPTPPEGDGRVLWRVDGLSRGTPNATELRLFVASPVGPDLSEVTERIAPIDRIATRDLTPLLDALSAGDRYSFRIAVNPTRYVRSDAPGVSTDGRHLRTHKRAPITTLTAQLDWLANRLAAAGARIIDTDFADSAVPDVVPLGSSSDRFRRGKNKLSSPVELLRTHFQGHLTVLDPIALRTAMLSGVGPAKGYGCGLLTLAPAAR